MAIDSTTYSTTGEVTTWQVITGSARGAAHRASGLPNQDAVASQDGPGGVVVAIADGHGHIRHFRSADGAALAVDVACRVASRAAAELAADATGDEEAALAGQELARAVVADWRSAVADQLEVRPYTAQEQSIPGFAAGTPLVPYGSTLLAVLPGHQLREPAGRPGRVRGGDHRRGQRGRRRRQRPGQGHRAVHGSGAPAR
jgi:hypothetical protein